MTLEGINTEVKSRYLVNLIVAARPNFMKVAPLYHALTLEEWCTVHLVHTGQHYDENMSRSFIDDLRLPPPHFHLQVGSGSHAEQTGRTMIEYERVCSREAPAAVVVVGDVNATVACALVGAKAGIPVIHLEAGLRSRDRRMPEEINRLATDAVADLLWTPSLDANENLLCEGIPPERIECVGNLMIDSLEMMMAKIEAANTLQRFKLRRLGYAVVTLHRPSNVDEAPSLRALVGMLERIAQDVKLVFPIHPRTRTRLKEFGLEDVVSGNSNIVTTEPLGYIDFMCLVKNSVAAITDSGGIQEETTYLGVPCITLRENTERPVTISQGTNRLSSPQEASAAVREAVAGKWSKGRRPEYWDGRAAQRAVTSLRRFLQRRVA